MWAAACGRGSGGSVEETWGLRMGRGRGSRNEENGWNNGHSSWRSEGLMEEWVLQAGEDSGGVGGPQVGQPQKVFWVLCSLPEMVSHFRSSPDPCEPELEAILLQEAL